MNRVLTLFYIQVNLCYKILSSSELVDNEEQSLILENKPTFIDGENILGYLTFKTKNYYRTSEGFLAEDIDEEISMHKLNMTGFLYFRCKVKKEPNCDE